MSTNKQQINAKNERIKLGIMPLLDWSENEYQDFKMRGGCAFLQNYMPQQPEFIDELIETALFWRWWCNQWLIRDEVFLTTEGIAFIGKTIRVCCYKHLHNPVELAKELIIDSIVFEGTSICKKQIPAL